MCVCVCTRMHKASMRGAIGVGWVNGDGCGLQRNVRPCLAAS